MEIVLRKGADLVALRLLQDRMGMGTAVGRRAWVAGELSSGLGSGVGFWVTGERALGAQLSCCERLGREPPAQVLWGSGCAQPGEARKTTGEEGGSGRDGGRQGRGGRPRSARAWRARAHSLGFSGP